MKIRLPHIPLAALVVDGGLMALGYYLAYLIRFDFDPPLWALRTFGQTLVYVVAFKLLCFYFFDLYQGMWRYTSLNDLISLVKASSLASILILVFILFKNRFEMVARSVFIIDWCLTVMAAVSVRLLTRLCFEEFTEEIGFSALVSALAKVFRRSPGRQGRGVIIVGAGDCGRRLLREFRENPNVRSHVVGFLDDDPSKIGRKIQGVSVLNRIDHLEHAVRAQGVDDVIIAIPHAGAERMKEIVALCRKAEVNFKTVPDMGEVIDGRISLSAIRDVEYRDLLGRAPVSLDKAAIGSYLGGQSVLVTGGGGSIGTGLCRQICRFSPRRLVVLERAESPLYEIELALKKNFPHVEIVPVLGDIQDQTELSAIFARYTPAIVFHAAAYKHVPMLEGHPWKAVENNVQGTANLIEAAKALGCQRFVFVSTDKAVNPTNVMGASKRIAEQLVQRAGRKAGGKTKFMTVRFGNVIGSVGSVIPLFKKQIKEGGPVTVTHPEMIRYFMLIPEACQLILQAGAMGEGGEVFVLEMGKPVNIDSMARDLIRFSGFEPDKDIKIEYTGLRPGEKLYEELITAGENVVPTHHAKIMVLRGQDLENPDFEAALRALGVAARERDTMAIRQGIRKLVPEYQPFGQVNGDETIG